MFCFLRKTLLHSRNGYSVTAHNPLMGVSSSLRFLSIDANQCSFALTYLINTCALSPESALSASKLVKFGTPEKPDLMLSFFQKLGFSKHQISEIIRKHPKLLLFNPEKSLLPKVEFFLSKGISTPDLVKIFTRYPWILNRSLENHLIPSFNFLRELFQTEERAIAAVKRYPGMLYYRLQSGIIPNINTLRGNGVPEANILFLVWYYPQTIIMNPDKFGKIVGEVGEIGVNPLNSQFVLAIMVLSLFSKSYRDQKVEAYKSWGWSDEGIISVFKKYPHCMTISKDKIMAVMDFYINELGLDSSVIANQPVLLSLSLKKRLIPRAAVIQFLSSKGLVKLDSSIIRLFKCTEKYFVERFINDHKEAPHLLKLYHDKLDLSKQQDHQEKEKK